MADKVQINSTMFFNGEGPDAGPQFGCAYPHCDNLVYRRGEACSEACADACNRGA